VSAAAVSATTVSAAIVSTVVESAAADSVLEPHDVAANVINNATNVSANKFFIFTWFWFIINIYFLLEGIIIMLCLRFGE
jgi:hypothetical protein